ncbi:MAG TPA: transglycosylase SLT domain-containing protein [Anaerolineaceae bacterium]
MSRVQLAFIPAMLIGIGIFLAITGWISGRAPAVQAADNPIVSQPVQAALADDPANTTSSLAVPAQTGLTTNGAVMEVPEVEPIFVTVTLQPHEQQSLTGQNASGSLQGCALRSTFAGSVLQWCDLIQIYAAANGLEPALVAALITQESGGDPSAYSSSGAVGLMQVMPRDGLAASFMCIAGPCFVDRPSIQELSDPEFNIAYGTKMLSSLLQRHGNMRDALKNYGPRDVGYYYADLVLGIFENNR